MPFDDRELRDLTAAVIARHGAGALAHVAERIGHMIIADDDSGIATWKAVADRLCGAPLGGMGALAAA